MAPHGSSPGVRTIRPHYVSLVTLLCFPLALAIDSYPDSNKTFFHLLQVSVYSELMQRL